MKILAYLMLFLTTTAFADNNFSLNCVTPAVTDAHTCFKEVSKAYHKMGCTQDHANTAENCDWTAEKTENGKTRAAFWRCTMKSNNCSFPTGTNKTAACEAGYELKPLAETYFPVNAFPNESYCKRKLLSGILKTSEDKNLPEAVPAH